MSHALTLARPYARAAFALARENAALPQWSQWLGFAAAAVLDARVSALLGNPRITAATLRDLVLPPQADARFIRFLDLLLENGRLAVLPDIAALYETLRADEERVLKAKVTAAVALDAQQLASIRNALQRRFGRDVEIEMGVDPDLIGGAVITAGDVVIDGSIRGKLARLRSALTS